MVTSSMAGGGTNGGRTGGIAAQHSRGRGVEGTEATGRWRCTSGFCGGYMHAKAVANAGASIRQASHGCRAGRSRVRISRPTPSAPHIQRTLAVAAKLHRSPKHTNKCKQVSGDFFLATAQHGEPPPPKKTPHVGKPGAGAAPCHLALINRSSHQLPRTGSKTKSTIGRGRSSQRGSSPSCSCARSGDKPTHLARDGRIPPHRTTDLDR
ncbi:hypothetical protein BRADI_3g23367v3 [Brachypodium distachyon]|uniref:Uncharacterized protein n=1 Tax=Brachypodium distachyon TaxID=15368 RepID=A0A2K2CZ39_BRADI|nr:hypothetical protein BRADI_3g23367v3 [Brachypodium distachyon]